MFCQWFIFHNSTLVVLFEFTSSNFTFDNLSSVNLIIVFSELSEPIQPDCCASMKVHAHTN